MVLPALSAAILRRFAAGYAAVFALRAVEGSVGRARPSSPGRFALFPGVAGRTRAQNQRSENRWPGLLAECGWWLREGFPPLRREAGFADDPGASPT